MAGGEGASGAPPFLPSNRKGSCRGRRLESHRPVFGKDKIHCVFFIVSEIGRGYVALFLPPGVSNTLYRSQLDAALERCEKISIPVTRVSPSTSVIIPAGGGCFHAASQSEKSNRTTYLFVQGEGACWLAVKHASINYLPFPFPTYYTPPSVCPVCHCIFLRDNKYRASLSCAPRYQKGEWCAVLITIHLPTKPPPPSVRIFLSSTREFTPRDTAGGNESDRRRRAVCLPARCHLPRGSIVTSYLFLFLFTLVMIALIGVGGENKMLSFVRVPKPGVEYS